MKDLNLRCDWCETDQLIVGKTETGKVVVDIYEEGDTLRVLLDAGKAKQLRDWLNQFLGE